MKTIIKNAAINGKYRVGHHPNGKTYLLCDISVGDLDANKWFETIRFTFDANNWNSDEFSKIIIDELEYRIECNQKIKETVLKMLNDFYNHYKINNTTKG